MSDKKDLIKTIDRIKWYLNEIKCSDPEDIESNDLEIMGETQSGQEGFFTVQINKVAGDALELVNQLEARNADFEALNLELAKLRNKSTCV